MIRALDKKTGQVKWDYDIRKDGEQSQFHGDPLIADQLVVIGTDGRSGTFMPSKERQERCAGNTKLKQQGLHPISSASKIKSISSQLQTIWFASTCQAANQNGSFTTRIHPKSIALLVPLRRLAKAGYILAAGMDSRTPWKLNPGN